MSPCRLIIQHTQINGKLSQVLVSERASKQKKLRDQSGISPLCQTFRGLLKNVGLGISSGWSLGKKGGKIGFSEASSSVIVGRITHCCLGRSKRYPKILLNSEICTSAIYRTAIKMHLKQRVPNKV